MDQLARLSELNAAYGFESFSDKLKKTKSFPLRTGRVEILQVNCGKRCNLSCGHCHVGAGPERTEVMNKRVFELCLEAAEKTSSIEVIDITGGSPEMNPHLEWFIGRASRSGKRVAVRSNLSILSEEGYSKFVEVYKEYKVEICASIPCYTRENVDGQRGGGVYERCIKVLKTLNKVGYGTAGSGLVINLVYNPGGAYLPGAQKELERDYKENLMKEHGIVFNNLFCITNMPIGRFYEYLSRTGKTKDYLHELVNTYNQRAADRVMCKNTVSVSWDGRLYDCDFNQVLGLPVSSGNCLTIGEFDAGELNGRDISVHNHCYGCTAGNGSSCRGSA